VGTEELWRSADLLDVQQAIAGATDPPSCIAGNAAGNDEDHDL